MLDTSLDSFNFYFLLAVIQGVIISVLVIFIGLFKRTNLYFGLLILFFSLSLLHMMFEDSIVNFNAKFPIPLDFTLAFGPLAYLHILEIKNPLRKFNKLDLLHFLPAILIDGLFFFISRSYLGANPQWANNHSNLILIIATIIITLGVIQLAVYTYFIYKEFNDTKQVLRDFANVKSWLIFLLISWSILIVFLSFSIPFILFFIEEFDNYKQFIYKPLCVIIGLLIYVLGYAYLITYNSSLRNYMDKVKNFRFTNEELDEKIKMVFEAIKNEELFKDPHISVAKLAGHIGWPINNLSSIIN